MNEKNEKPDAIISFRPICSVCGEEINDIIDCIEDELYEESSRQMQSKLNFAKVFFPRICPSICKHCGSIFRSIEMPTGLPYNNIKDLVYRKADD